MRDATAPVVELRPAVDADAEACGRIVFEAFNRFSELRSFPREFSSVEGAVASIAARIAHAGIYAVVAEHDGTVVGSNFLDERDPIRGIGPLSVDPDFQGAGLGRRLMEAVIERGRDAVGLRLLQDAHNPVSIALYASLGFVAREPTAWLRGRASGEMPAGHEVRRMEESDLDACERLCAAVHGFSRTNELRDAIGMPMLSPFVATCGGRLCAYVSSVSGPYQLAHGVAVTDDDLTALIRGATAIVADPVELLLPIRQGQLFRWCLTHGLRVLKPMTLMSLGEYREPSGAWFPSVLY